MKVKVPFAISAVLIGACAIRAGVVTNDVPSKTWVERKIQGSAAGILSQAESYSDATCEQAKEYARSLASFGTPRISTPDGSRWTDATGCVWRIERGAGFGEWRIDTDVSWVPDGAMEWDEERYAWVHSGSNSSLTRQDDGSWSLSLFDLSVIKVIDDLAYTNLTYSLVGDGSYVNLSYVPGTVFVGRVALTNDVMPRAEVEARFADVDRPYSMIYDPVAGRALTADGRLVDYGRAPRIAGHFVLTPDSDSSSSSFPDGFMPTIALLGGRTNLVEGVDWTSTITPSSPDGSGGYYVSTADIAWTQTNAGGYMIGVLPVSAQIVKAVSSFGTSCSLSLGGVGYTYYETDVPIVGHGEVSIYETIVSGNTVTLYWSFYDYNYWNYYSGTDVFRLEFVDEGGDGVQAVAFGNRGRFATLDDLSEYVENEVGRRMSDSDTVRSSVRLRTGKPMEYGDGWGRIRYDFVGDRRWWELQVPNMTPTVTASGFPFTRTDCQPASIEREFVRSSGTNGTERCLASVWDVVAHFGTSDIRIGYVTVTNGIGVTSFNLTMPESGATFYTTTGYSSQNYTAWDLRVSSQSGIPGSNPTINLNYSYKNGSSTVYTGYATIRLSTSNNSYTIVAPEYFRVVATDIQHMFWDDGMQCTWNVAVSNGSFFAEVVSTTNLLSSGVSK